MEEVRPVPIPPAVRHRKHATTHPPPTKAKVGCSIQGYVPVVARYTTGQEKMEEVRPVPIPPAVRHRKHATTHPPPTKAKVMSGQYTGSNQCDDRDFLTMTTYSLSASRGPLVADFLPNNLSSTKQHYPEKSREPYRYGLFESSESEPEEEEGRSRSRSKRSPSGRTRSRARCGVCEYGLRDLYDNSESTEACLAGAPTEWATPAIVPE